tara:strand:- start:201 stop:371 length:171 start_codon:yes stop_codon:yes gene_type:complete
MLKWFVAATPIAGAIVIPLMIPFTIYKFGISTGIVFALSISFIWFILMLKTSEMPH